MSNLAISIIMPALNEESNIELAVTNSLQALDNYSINGEVIIVNDGSTDSTRSLVEVLSKKDVRIRIINHEIPQGIGASFWDGVDNTKANTIVMMPGDNENDPLEILRYYKLLDHVDMVIPFVFNKRARSVFRNILSFVYRLIINMTFLVNFNYTNGTVIYRKSILNELDYKSSGFFFQTDILIRAIKKGYLFAEVPYRLGARSDGISKAVSFPSFKQVVKGYVRLVKDIYRNKKEKGNFATDSLTFTRSQKVD